MDCFLTTLVVFLVTALLNWLVKGSKKNKVLPPGPRGLPILGHLHLLGRTPHKNLHNLSKKHGPIMFMRFGMVPTIVVSSPEAAEQFLKTHDQVFASRPHLEASDFLSYNRRNLIFAPYGPYWRNIRKLCTLQLFSSHKINSFQPMRREELGVFVESLKRAAQNRDAVDLSRKVSSLSGDMTCRMLFGKTFNDDELDQRGFRGLMQEIMEVVAAPNLGDFFPLVGVLDVQGLRRRFKAVSKVFDEFLERILDEHEEARDQGQIKDFVDTLLAVMKSGEAGFDFGRLNIKAILTDMLVAGTDTSAAAIEWTMSELLKNPPIMKKVQKEVEQVVGMDRLVEESDLESLEYLDQVVKESLRLHPVGPLLLPHESLEDCEVDGYHIPKGSRIIINVGAIGRDPNAWSDPEEYIPERFSRSNIDVRGRDFQLLPFGSGRRSCPGMQLGLIVVRLVIAQLVHCFNWKLPNDIQPTALDMSEHFGLVVSRGKQLVAIPYYRLQN